LLIDLKEIEMSKEVFKGKGISPFFSALLLPKPIVLLFHFRHPAVSGKKGPFFSLKMMDGESV
jgi:hypothetical protein